jgi:membrane fusion protein (multidrug efflux system)
MNKQRKQMGTKLATTGANSSYALGLLLASVSVLSGCSEKKAPPPAAPQAMPVTVVQVHPTDVAISNDWVGTLDGYVNAQIQPQANGYLIKQN